MHGHATFFLNRCVFCYDRGHHTLASSVFACGLTAVTSREPLNLESKAGAASLISYSEVSSSLS